MDRARGQVKARRRASRESELIAVRSASAAALLAWFDRGARDLPWRRQADPYGVWVSEIMLQQTQVRTVIPYWNRWMEILPDIPALARAEESEVLKLWEGLGYYSRARNLLKSARLLVSRGQSQLPGSVEALLELPGIGRYTAGAIASIAFGQPAPILDGNVIRVLSRVHLLTGDPKQRDTNARLWEQAGVWVLAAGGGGVSGGRSRFGDLNQALMELGATVCQPAQPACPACPLSAECGAFRTGQQARFPESPARVKSEPRWFATLVVRHRDRFWVRQRAAGEVNAGFWEFPNVELPAGDADPVAALTEGFGVDHEALMARGELRHSITRYRMTQRLYSLEWKGPVGKHATLGEGQWVSRAELERLALTAAHRKVCGYEWFAQWNERVPKV